jgi:hypothetical protein
MKSDRSKRLAKMIREGKIRPASELASGRITGGSFTLTSGGRTTGPIPFDVAKWSASTCPVPVDDAERRALSQSFIEEVRAKAIAEGMSEEDFDAELARLRISVIGTVRESRDRGESRGD